MTGDPAQVAGVIVDEVAHVPYRPPGSGSRGPGLAEPVASGPLSACQVTKASSGARDGVVAGLGPAGHVGPQLLVCIDGPGVHPVPGVVADPPVFQDDGQPGHLAGTGIPAAVSVGSDHLGGCGQALVRDRALRRVRACGSGGYLAEAVLGPAVRLPLGVRVGAVRAGYRGGGLASAVQHAGAWLASAEAGWVAGADDVPAAGQQVSPVRVYDG
jgi:hypothetical protein